MHFLPRILPPDVTWQTMEGHDALIEWALVSIMVGQRATEMGLAISDEVRENIGVARRQPLLNEEAIRRARLPLREEGYSLSSAVGIWEPAPFE